jgi:hypothetical protein
MGEVSVMEKNFLSRQLTLLRTRKGLRLIAATKCSECFSLRLLANQTIADSR